MRYQIVRRGQSRSFPAGDPFLAAAVETAAVVLYLGVAPVADRTKAAILIELGMECLGVHTGEEAGEEGSNMLGFGRYRNGDDDPSRLIELVRQPRSRSSAIEAATAAFEAAGFEVVLCGDQAGRIVDRLVRPKYNTVLRFLDEGLATAEDLDLTCPTGARLSGWPHRTRRTWRFDPPLRGHPGSVRGLWNVGLCAGPSRRSRQGAGAAVMAGPLSGTRILDFTTLLPGPVATLLLAEAGAEVIKIERPGRGDEMRSYTPKWGSDSVNFAMLNRGKRSLALDLKDPATRARMARKIEQAIPGHPY